MDNLIKSILNYWLWISIISSIIWGLYGGQFVKGIQGNWFNKIFAYFYQFNFNFVGSFAGWCCFYVLGNRYLNPQIGLNSVDLTLFILVLLGLTGHLPQALFGIVKAFAQLGEIAVGRLMKDRPQQKL